MLESPQTGAQQVNEGLWGEILHILSESDNGYVECCLEHDRYRGFVLQKHIAGEGARPDSDSVEPIPEALLVVARSTLLFSEPDIKSRVVHRLPLLSRIFTASSNYVPVMGSVIESDAQSAACSTQERFVPTSDGCYALIQHLRKIKEHRQATAKQGANRDALIDWAESLFMGAPYLWGGRTPAGSDCSGLVQSVATLAGYSLPRDSKPQEQAISLEVEASERQRGDLVFWPGHVGILAQPDMLLHATSYSMDCRLELLEDVNLRAGKPSSIRRLQ